MISTSQVVYQKRIQRIDDYKFELEEFSIRMPYQIHLHKPTQVDRTRPVPAKPTKIEATPDIHAVDEEEHPTTFQPDLRWLRDHPQEQVIGDIRNCVRTHAPILECMMTCFLSQIKPKIVEEALSYPDWVLAMQE